MACRVKNALLFLRSISQYRLKFLSLPEKVIVGNMRQELPGIESCPVSETVLGMLHALTSTPVHS